MHDKIAKTAISSPWLPIEATCMAGRLPIGQHRTAFFRTTAFTLDRSVILCWYSSRGFY